MTDENLNQPAADATPAPVAETKARSPWGRRILIGAGALAVVAGVGVAGAMSGGFGHKWGHHGFGKHGMMRDFAEFRIERMMGEIGASTEQTDKIKTIFSETAEQVMPGMGKGDGNGPRGPFGPMREQMMELMKAPTIDRAAIEKLRAEHVAMMDEKSKVVAKAVADAAEVLTAEQRLKLIEMIDRDRPRQ